MPTKLSIIVCSYNGSHLLDECIQSIIKQVSDHKSFELIVVNNNSNDNTESIINKYASSCSFLHVLFELNQGLSYARNRGLSKASGEYIAYIDDDARLSDNWLNTALNIIETKKPDIFGGPAFPIFQNGKPSWFKEKYGIRGDMGETGWLTKGFLIGTNIIFHKELLLEYGGFNTNTGMQGSTISYHEETILVHRAFKENRKVYFSKELRVNDLIPEYKKSILFFLYSKYKAGKDGHVLWKRDLSVDNLVHLLKKIDSTMEELNTALMSRDVSEHKYPENYLLEKTLGNFFDIGLTLNLYLKNDQFLSRLNSSEKEISELSFKKSHQEGVTLLKDWDSKLQAIAQKFDSLKRSSLVSVIIPNYNNSIYLRQCLDSVLEQTYKCLEVVICDDCSTDNSKEILDEYKKRYKNIKIIYNQENLGVSKTRDIAIANSNGKYITTLDSDDFYICKQKIEKELHLIWTYENQGKEVIAFSNVYVVDEKGQNKTAYQGGKKIAEGNLLTKILARSCMIPRDFLFTRESYNNVGGFDLSRKLLEDWDLKIRLANQYEYYFTGLDAIAYRRKGHGLSYTIKSVLAKAAMDVFDTNSHLIKNNDDLIKCKKKLESKYDVA